MDRGQFQHPANQRNLGQQLPLAIDTTNGNYTYGSESTDPAGQSIGLTKVGTNTLTLGVTNSYSGVTTVFSGILEAATPGSPPNDPARRAK